MSDVVLVDIGIGSTKVNAFRYSKHIDAVSACAFTGNVNLTAVELPDVTKFQDTVFSGCSSLQEIMLPAIDYTGVDIFGNDVPPIIKRLSFKKTCSQTLKLGDTFSRLSSLEEIDFDDALAEFDNKSLLCSICLKKFDFGNACNVAENALSGFSSLEEIYIPAQQSVKTYGLQKLKSIKKVVIRINGNDALTSLEAGLLNDMYAGQVLFENAGNKIMSISSGSLSGLSVHDIDFRLSRLHDIPTGAFKNDSCLVEVQTGPLQLTSIGENAFEGCNDVKLTDAYGYSYLKEMHPHGAKRLELQKLYSNTCLQYVAPSAFMNVSIASGELNAPMLVNAGEYAFACMHDLVSADFGCRMHAMPAYCYSDDVMLEHVTIQSNVDVIKQHAFRNCSKLSSVSLVGSRIRLGDYAMQGLSSLKSFDVSKVTYVGKCALQGCSRLSFSSNSLVNVKFIGENGFADAIHTASADIRYDIDPVLLSNIEKNAFARCEIAGFNVKASIVELNEVLSAYAGKSLLPESRDDVKGIVRAYNALKSWLGITSDFEMILDDFVLNSNGSGLDYTCFIYNNSKDKITGLIVNEDMFKFIQQPVFPSRAKSIAYNALNVDVFKKSVTKLNLNNITSVDVGQFSNCKSLTSFIAPKLQTLPDCCLCGCTSLLDVELSQCSSVHDTAFYGCSSISSAYAPEANMRMLASSSKALLHAPVGAGEEDGDVFCEDPAKPGRVKSVNDKNVTNATVVMPRTFSNDNIITSIGSYSMRSTTKITSLSIGSNVAVIEDNAFTDNVSISSVCITSSSTVASIGDDAFKRSSIVSFSLPYMSKLGSVVRSYGLNKSDALQSFSAADGYTSVASCAFIDCEPMMSSVALPASIATIGQSAFAESKSFFPRIKSINLNDLTSLSFIGDYAFYNSIITQFPSGELSSKLVLPSSVKTIGTAAFGYSVDTRTQQIEDATIYAESIGPSAFMRSHFRTIRLNFGLSSIGDYAFANPKYKYTMCIPDSVSTIGTGAFKRNVILNPAAIEKNVISCDFESARMVLSVMHAEPADDFTAPNTVSATDDTVFIALRAPAYSNYVYAKNGVLNICPGYLSVDILSRSVIKCDTSHVSAFLPDYVHHISAAAFKDCIVLTAVSAAYGNIGVGESAFYNCGNLAGINLPSSFHLSVIPSYAFYMCSSLYNVRALSNALCIGDYAFAGCMSMSSVQDVIAAERRNFTLKLVGDHAFDGCSSLTSFFLPHDISALGEDVFISCISMKTIEVDLDASEFLSVMCQSSEALCSIGDVISSKFGSMNDDAGCAIVFNDSVYMNDGTVKIDDEYVTMTKSGVLSAVKSLNQEMFLSSGLSYLNLSNISEVKQFAFRDAYALETICFLPGEQRLSSIGDYAFSKCSSLRSLNDNMLSDVSYIGMYAFSGCSQMSEVQLGISSLSSIGYGAFSGTKISSVIVWVPDDGEADVADKHADKLKCVIGFDRESNQNPLALLEDCVIQLVSIESGVTLGKYDYMMNDLLNADIDINRNQIVFIDKRNDAIKPLVLVKSLPGRLPALTSNQFHMNVVGRWK